ncbi:hypothetical protein Spock_260 [Bacillus phage Spock]|uniref:Uncharacterized protein n=1 Tax=Bacillus phage Spock TaxID=1406791 RepID=U5PXD2_9CAUD|nr:hypothetical protein Spock_260 [Bacillus phage Spock]AGY48660.1 hypothetical protein Spock_260 [Bacillus phage Spock]
MKQLTLTQYDTLEALDFDIDVLESFYEYDGSTYVCDAITEIADNFIPIYTNELWEGVPKIKEYIEEAIAQGLCETPRGQKVELENFYRAGYYQYFTQLLYNNETELCYNYIAKLVNKWIESLTYDQREKLDINELDERVEYERADIDNNSYMEELEDIAKRVIAEFKGKVNKDASWTNYGDVNALEHGGDFIKKDSDYPLDKCYYYVKVINMYNACGEDGYRVEEGYIDLNDSWIDWNAVETTCDVSDRDEIKVIDVVSYYGMEEFNGETYNFDDETEVLEHLAAKGICIEN